MFRSCPRRMFFFFKPDRKVKPMQKFIEYILSFQPDFLEKVEGATPEEIESLERTIGFPLPQQYKEFLLLMGKNTGSFSFGAEEETANINEIIEFYEEIKEDGETISEDYVVVVLGFLDRLCILNEDADGESKVMILDGNKIVGYEAQSLENMLLKMAFTLYKLPSFPHYRTYSDASREKRLPLAEEIVNFFDFKTLWFSDATEICAQKDNAAISISQTQFEGMTVGGVVVYVAANSKEEAKRIGDVFERELKTKLVNVDDKLYRNIGQPSIITIQKGRMS